MPLSLGDNLGPYQIVAPIGAGGMGEVWKARDTRLGREVAIKVSAQQFTERFEREARAVAALNHPNICHLYDVATSPDGFGYLVMEFVEGESPKGPLPAGEVLTIGRQIAAALEAAHEKGIIHRDLKPANLKITPDGTVKVLDFGLAKIESGSEPASENSPTITMNATQAGVILGTAAYMSPEQARGKRVDKRADIWAFGVVMYELLTGDRPFGGETVADTLIEVATRQPDWERVPVELRPLLRKCLEKDPGKRLRDIGDMDMLLERGEASAAAPIEPAQKRTRWLWPSIAGSLAAAAGAFAFLWLRPAPLPQVVRFEIHAPEGSSLPLGTPAVSPDGRSIAYTVNDPDGKTRIHVRPIDRVETWALPGTEDGVHPFWSADSRSLAFVADLTLKRIDVEGGPPRNLGAVTGPWHGTWNQYGDILLQQGNGVNRVSADGGPETLATGATGPESGAHPFFLPDGKRFLINVARDSGSIQLATLGSQTHTVVLSGVNSAPVLAPTPGGKTYLLFLRDADLLAQEFDPRSGTLRGSPSVVVSNIGRVALPSVKPALGTSPAGILAYQTGSTAGTGQLTWFDRSGKPASSLPLEDSGAGVQLSPDGRSAAMIRTAAGGEDVWITDLVRKSSSRLTFDKSAVFSVAWSADGKRLAYLSLGMQQGVLHIVDAADSTKDQKLDASGRAPASWSPDGKFLLTYYAGGRMRLIPLTGSGQPMEAGSANGNSGQGRFSPDGNYIAFTSNESGRREIYVQRTPPAAGEWKVSIEGGSAPRWRKDGKELFFVSTSGAMMAVDVKPGDAFFAGIPHQLFDAKGISLTDYDVRADGQQFLVLVPQRGNQDFPITVALNWWVALQNK